MDMVRFEDWADWIEKLKYETEYNKAVDDRFTELGESVDPTKGLYIDPAHDSFTTSAEPLSRADAMNSVTHLQQSGRLV